MVCSIVAAAATTLSSEVTSRATPNASTPAPRRSLDRLRASGLVTRADGDGEAEGAQPWAMAKPMPLFAPVTSAVFVSFT